MDDQQELRLFVDLCRTLNFGRTSLDRHVSPATLTRAVQRLESRAGHRLLDRGPRGVAITAEGQRFREYAEQALQLWQTYAHARPEPAALTGALGLFATVTACQALLPDLLAPLRRSHPDVRLDIRTGDAATALARLDEGDVDAAVAGIPSRIPEALASRTIAVTELVFVTAGDRPDPDLAGPLVVPHRGLVRDAADQWYRARGARPDIAAEPDGHESLLTLVALGCGTGIVPRIVLDTSRVRDRLTVVPADPPLRPMTLGLCVRRTELRRPLVAALWNLADPGTRASRGELRPSRS